MCGESWHAIKGSVTHRPSSPLCVCMCMCVCVCMCVFGGLSSFYTWMEGLCVVGGGGGGGGGGYRFFLVFLYS